MKAFVRFLTFLVTIHFTFATEDQEISPAKKVWIEFWQLLTDKEIPTTNLGHHQAIEKSASFLACLLLRPEVNLSADSNLTNVHQQNFTSLMSPLWVQRDLPVPGHYLNNYLENLYLREDTGDNPLVLSPAVLQKPVVAVILPWLTKAQHVLTLDHVRYLHDQLKIIWEINSKGGRVKYNDIVRILYPLEHLYINDSRSEGKALEQWINENSLATTRLSSGEVVFKSYQYATKRYSQHNKSFNLGSNNNLLDSWLRHLDLWSFSDSSQIHLIRGIAQCMIGWSQENVSSALNAWPGWQDERNRLRIMQLAPGADLELTNFLVEWQKLFPGNEDIYLTEISSNRIFWDLLDVYRIYLPPTVSRSNLVLKGVFDNFDDLSLEKQKIILTALTHQIDIFLTKDPSLLQVYLIGKSRLVDILIDRLESSDSEIKELLLLNIHKILAHDERINIGRDITPKRLLALYKSLEGPSPLQAILVDLTKDHPGWDLAYRLYEVFGEVQGSNGVNGQEETAEDCLRVPGGGYFILKASHREQLWDTRTGEFIAINRNRARQGAGKREVGALKKDSSIPGIPEICVKRFPEFPALESSVTSFMNQLMGRGGIPSILVHYKPDEPWLLTPRIQLLENYNRPIPLRIDEAVLLAMLTNPEDGNIHNYGVVEARDGTPYVVGIDNDHGFIPTLGMEVMDGGKKYTLQVKSLLFCLDEIKIKEVSPALIEKLKTINAEDFLKQWLRRLQPLEESYLSLFPHKGIPLIKDKMVQLPDGTQTITLADDSIFTGMMFQESMISCLFEKFQQLRQVLYHLARPMTYIELLAQIDPPIWRIYKDILQEPARSSFPIEGARERFMTLHGIHYIRVGEKIVSCTTMCGLAAALCGEKETRPEALREAIVEGKWGTKDGLAYFTPIAEVVNTNEEIERFKKLRTNAAKISRLKELSRRNESTPNHYWSTLSPAQQTDWINLMRQDLIRPPAWKWLYLPPISGLTLSEFSSWRMIGIQDLTLDSCLSGKPETLEIIANNSEALQRLNLRNLDWEGLEIPQSFWGIPLPSGQQRFEWLNTLEIENCANLRRIKLITPNLKRIKIHDIPLLTYGELVSFTRRAPFLLIHRGTPGDQDNPGDLYNMNSINNDDITLLTYDPHFPWEELQGHKRTAIREAAQFPEDYNPSVHFYSPLIRRTIKDFTNFEQHSSYNSNNYSSIVASLGVYSVSHSHHESNGNGPYDFGKTVQDPPTYHGFYSRFITTCSHIAYYLENLDLRGRDSSFGYFLTGNANSMRKLQSLTLGSESSYTFSILPTLINLEKLEISIKRSGFKQLFFKYIVQMKKLKQLKLHIDETLLEYSSSDVPPSDLSSLSNLQEFSLIGGNSRFRILPSTLSSAFSVLTNLRSLTLDRVFHNSMEYLTSSLFSPLKNLNTLILINNPLWLERGAFALANALPSLPQITYLDLSGNSIGDSRDSWSGFRRSSDGATALAPVLATLNNLKYLNLGRNSLEKNSAQILLSAILKPLDKLQILQLQGNSLSAAEGMDLAQQFIDHVSIEKFDLFSEYEMDKNRMNLNFLIPTLERNRSARIARNETVVDIQPQDPSYSLASNRFDYPRAKLEDFHLPPSSHVFLDHLDCIRTVLNVIQNDQRLFPQNTTLYVTKNMGLWLAGFYLRENGFSYQMHDLEQWYGQESNANTRGSITESQLANYFGDFRLSDLFHENTPNLVFALKEQTRDFRNPGNVRQWTLNEAIDEIINKRDAARNPLLKDLITYLLTNNPVHPNDLRNEHLIIPPFSIT